MAGVANRAGASRVFKFITSSPAAAWAMIRLGISSLFASSTTRTFTDMGMTRQTQVANVRNSLVGSNGNLWKRRACEVRTGAVFRDAPVFASGYFKRTKFL